MALAVATMKEIALVIFFAVFVLILVRLILARSEPYRRAASMPLEPDDAAPTGGTGRTTNDGETNHG